MHFPGLESLPLLHRDRQPWWEVLETQVRGLGDDTGAWSSLRDSVVMIWGLGLLSGSVMLPCTLAGSASLDGWPALFSVSHASCFRRTVPIRYLLVPTVPQRGGSWLTWPASRPAL